jgi:hydroxymethylglutaryl-CoA lyase
MVNTFPAQVEIREVGPREGFQSFHRVVPTSDKLRLIEALAQSGIREIEVTSFVRPDRVPQLADAEALVAGLTANPQIHYTALCLNQTGFKRSEATGKLNTRGWLYTSPSNSFLEANSNTTLDDSIRAIAEWCQLFRAHSKSLHGLMISNAFGCSYEGSVSSQAVRDVVDRYCQEFARNGEVLKEICLADTVGMGTPRLVEECITALQPLGIPLSLHLHDTRGLGLVNAFVGLKLGITIFESSVGGIGGCPFTAGAAGNIATEDLVYLCESLGVKTGINLPALCRAAHLCEAIMGMPLPGRVYKTMLKN